MKRQFLAVSVGVSLLASLPAASQNMPASDTIRAPSWLRSPTEVSVNYSSLGRRYQNGPEISVSKNFWRGMGAEADLSDYFYRGYSQPYSNGLSFLFGPRFSMTPARVGSGRITLFGHALAGSVRSRQLACNYITVTINGVTSSCTQFNHKTAFQTALGGGADLRMSTHFAVRLGQFDYIHAYYPQDDERYLRFSTGAVFLLGAVSPVPPLRSSIMDRRLDPEGELFVGPSKMWVHASGIKFHAGGGEGSITGNFTRFVGLEAAFSVHDDIPQDPPDYSNHYTLLFGPHFAYRRNPSVNPFVHVLVGGTRGTQNILPPYPPGVIPNTSSALTGRTAFTAAFGGGLDVNAWRFLWIRAIQADYLRLSFPNFQNNLRLSFGLVFRFGSLANTRRH
jgi:hypothetical protein